LEKKHHRNPLLPCRKSNPTGKLGQRDKFGENKQLPDQSERISSEKRTCCEAQHPTTACEHAAQQEASDVNEVSVDVNEKSDQKPGAGIPSGNGTPPFLDISPLPPFLYVLDSTPLNANTGNWRQYGIGKPACQVKC
jgi:hypothetical protein